MATAATAPSAIPAAPSGDGRARRSARSRAAIETALFELVGEGILQPTVQEVAVRAGVAVRSVFRHFSDLESLFASIDARLRLEAAPLVEQAQPTGSVADRVRGMVHLRATIFERLAPYRRAADLQRWRSPFIRTQHHDLVRVLRSGLRRWLPELADAPPDVLEALELVTSFEAWARLRDEQRLGVARARAVMEGAALRLVAALADPAPRRSGKVRR